MMTTIGEVMSRGVKTVYPDATLDTVFRLMNTLCKRHIPVVDTKDRSLLGVISDRDVKKFLSPFVGTVRESSQDKALLDVKVEVLMRKPVETANADESLKEVVQRMLDKNIGSIVICDIKKVPIGIITRNDIIRIFMKSL